MTSRQSASGALLLLEEQDRNLWDQHEIQVGLEWQGRRVLLALGADRALRAP